MSLSSEQKAKVILSRAIDAVADHADLYPSADRRLRGVVTGTLVGVGFAAVVRSNGWLFALRVVVGAIIVAIKHPSLDALQTPGATHDRH